MKKLLLGSIITLLRYSYRFKEASTKRKFNGKFTPDPAENALKWFWFMCRKKLTWESTNKINKNFGFMQKWWALALSEWRLNEAVNVQSFFIDSSWCIMYTKQGLRNWSTLVIRHFCVLRSYLNWTVTEINKISNWFDWKFVINVINHLF